MVQHQSIHDLVVRDLAARKALGLRTYGRLLTIYNGRNALQDAYEEALDLACYLKQKLEEVKTCQCGGCCRNYK